MASSLDMPIAIYGVCLKSERRQAGFVCCYATNMQLLYIGNTNTNIRIILHKYETIINYPNA